MCPSDIELIQNIAGQLPEAQARALAEHLRHCSTCDARHRELESTYALLGAWQPQAPPMPEASHIVHAVMRRNWALGAGRIAAAIVLAAGAGVAAGLLWPINASTAPPGNVTLAVSDEEAAQAIGLDQLAGVKLYSALWDLPVSDDHNGGEL